MKTILTLILCSLIAGSASAQTMFIDYSEKTLENTGAIHIMEAKQTIETEEFDDVIVAKTKLIRIIENYRTAGYEVKATSVSTHPHGKGFHYHYQYILQQPPVMDENAGRSSKASPGDVMINDTRLERKVDRNVRSGSSAPSMSPDGSGAGMVSPSGGSKPPANSQPDDGIEEKGAPENSQNASGAKREPRKRPGSNMQPGGSDLQMHKVDK